VVCAANGDGEPARAGDANAEEVSRLKTVPFGPQRLIGTAAHSVRFAFPADLDGDGDLDMLSASALDDVIAWYENRLDEASADFGPQQIISSERVGNVSPHWGVGQPAAKSAAHPGFHWA
jgi:hypothetical protein